SRRSIRVAALATAAYVSFPIDFVPDFIPVAGQIDDIVVIALVLRFVVKRAGEDAIRRHWPGSEGGLRAVLRLAAPAR
ncbi:MAG TPA: DUF1232 domain-containing protein, partial [Solirubrobacterales bacterium]|nr:DUF1232 domain-containing protein [Solirubrobacterales bacterium]